MSGLLLLVGACNSDGRTMREARPDQTASVYTTTTSSTTTPSTITATIVDDLASSLPGSSVAGAEVPDVTFELNMPWEDGGVINSRYTCDGPDIQPAFSWEGAPTDAVDMAMVVVDVDTNEFVHWTVAGLDPVAEFVGENAVPPSAIEGTNSFSEVGWRGPCPPAGTTHRYLFTLYALSANILLPTGSSAEDLQLAIDAVSLSVAQQAGAYTRN